MCNAFLLEAQWFASKELPNEEDYLKNAIVSSGVHVVLVHMFFLLGQGITMETVNLLDQIPGLVSSTAAILRLWDDLGNAEVMQISPYIFYSYSRLLREKSYIRLLKNQFNSKSL